MSAAQASPEKRPGPHAPICILFLAAGPRSRDHLRTDLEFKTIQDRLRGSPREKSFAFVSRWAATPNDLRRALLEVEPEIVHFSGHGEADELIFDAEGGGEKRIDHAAIARLFGLLAGRIRVVVLNACHSFALAEATAQHVDCAIGMIRPVGDTAAIEFSAAFYEALAFGRPVDKAFELGKLAAPLNALGGSDTPRMTVRPGVDASRIVFAEPAAPPPSRIPALALVGAAAAVAGALVWQVTRPPPRAADPMPVASSTSPSAAVSTVPSATPPPPSSVAPTSTPVVSGPATTGGLPPRPADNPGASSSARAAQAPLSGTATCAGQQCRLDLLTGSFDGAVSACFNVDGHQVHCVSSTPAKGDRSVRCTLSAASDAESVRGGSYAWSPCGAFLSGDKESNIAR